MKHQESLSPAHQQAEPPPDISAASSTLRWMAKASSNSENKTQVSTWKRSRSEDDEDAKMNSENNSPRSPEEAGKKRKSTNTRRREEKTALQQELDALAAKLTALKKQMFTPTHASKPGSDEDEDDEDADPRYTNSLLRNAIQAHQLRAACTRSMLSTFLGSPLAVPVDEYLYLGTDKAERRRMLLSLSGRKVFAARRFMLARCEHIDKTRAYEVHEHFDVNNGDYIALRLDVLPFRGIQKLRDVYEAISFFVSNLEMSLMEGINCITIREDDDTGDRTVSQHKLVLDIGDGPKVETNTAIFVQLDEMEQWAVWVSCPVDRDDLHPYHPSERFRQDVTTISMITSVNETVVLMRYEYMRLHEAHHLQASDEVMERVRKISHKWGDSMIKFTRDQLVSDFAGFRPG